jgi:hypothetical protein
MFDSGHFFHDPLPRDTNWEIHPVLKIEYCPKGDETGVWVDVQHRLCSVEHNACSSASKRIGTAE